MSEPKERPDAPGIWQHRSTRWLYSVYEDLSMDVIGGVLGCCHEGQPVEYRLIIDADGKLVCDPQSPWPAEPKVEQRRLVVVRATGDAFHVYIEPVYSSMKFAYTCLDEIRECEVDDVGRVVKVLPTEKP